MATSTMKEDVEMAVRFIMSVVKNNVRLSREQVERFGHCLTHVLCELYEGHWYPENPVKGQAYRCIRINRRDPVEKSLLKACQESGVEYSELALPTEFTVWIDPGEVSCRLSESCYPFKVSEEYRSGKSTPELETSDYHSESPTPSESSSEDEKQAKRPGEAQAAQSHRQERSHTQQPQRYFYTPHPLWVPWQHNVVTYAPAAPAFPLYYVNLPSKPPPARRPNPDLVKRLTKRASKS